MVWPNNTWLGHGTPLKGVRLDPETKRAVKKACKHIWACWDKNSTVPPVPPKGKTKRERMVWAAYKIAKCAADQIN